MAITESEALAIAEEAARRALAARPVPSCVSLTDSAHIAACDPDTIRELLSERDQLAAALAAAQQRIAELERDLENERARGIHTCHDQCPRPREPSHD